MVKGQVSWRIENEIIEKIKKESKKRERSQGYVANEILIKFFSSKKNLKNE